MTTETTVGPARWHRELVAAIDRLEVLPSRHPLARRETSAFGVEVRVALVRRHRVYFSIHGRTVSVLAIRHEARRSPPR